MAKKDRFYCTWKQLESSPVYRCRWRLETPLRCRIFGFNSPLRIYLQIL